MDDDYREPRLILLRDLNPGGEIHRGLPVGCRDLARDIYIRRRNEMGDLIGGLELAWRRGYQAGQEDAQRDSKPKAEEQADEPANS